MAEFGKAKTIPASIRLPALIALSHFPELSTVQIRFEFKRSGLAYASRPDWTTMWYPRTRWRYLIVLSIYTLKVPSALLFDRLPFNAQIGILGHELSHTAYYINKRFHEIISTGVSYLNSDYRIKFENETDLETIRHGLGWQLLDFASYCRNHPEADPQFIKWLDKYYLNPPGIRNYIKADPSYSDYKHGQDQQEKAGI